MAWGAIAGRCRGLSFSPGAGRRSGASASMAAAICRRPTKRRSSIPPRPILLLTSGRASHFSARKRGCASLSVSTAAISPSPATTRASKRRSGVTKRPRGCRPPCRALSISPTSRPKRRRSTGSTRRSGRPSSMAGSASLPGASWSAACASSSSPACRALPIPARSAIPGTSTVASRPGTRRWRPRSISRSPD